MKGHELFYAFIKQYPSSSTGKEYEKYGEDLLNYSGSFTCALFKGEIFSALQHADTYNKQHLKDLLQHQDNFHCCWHCGSELAKGEMMVDVNTVEYQGLSVQEEIIIGFECSECGRKEEFC